MQLNKKSLFLLSLLTLIGMGGVGLSILVFGYGVSIPEFLHSGEVLHLQLFYGLSYGIGVGLLAVIAMNIDLLDETNAMFTDMIAELKPNVAEIIFYSLCAGIGEELLFRGGIQAFMGIWFTSFVFISLHGYLKFSSPMMAFFGLFMVCVSAGMGYLMEFHGIYAAISAHFVYDVILFLHLRNQVVKPPGEWDE